MASQPAKRVRTGCLKCRSRRRKCDEGKPRCQRCVAGGFECQYGTRLSFLQKNAFTVNSPGSAASPARETAHTPSYRRVQFADEVAGTPSNQQGSSTHIDGNNNSSTPANENDLSSSQPQQGSCVVNHFEESTSSPLNWINSPGTSGGDQIALDALLSLGHEHTVVLHGQESEHASEHAQVSTDQELHDVALSRDEVEAHQESGSQIELQYTGTAHGVPEDIVFSLLKSYRYDIAPWLDICDLGQAFGVTLSCLAVESEPVLQALLALSAASLKASSQLNHFVSSSHLADILTQPISAAGLEQRFVCDTLNQVQETFHKFGVRTEKQAAQSLSKLVDEVLHGSSFPLTAFYYLLLRLEMSNALIHATSIPLEIRDPATLPAPWHRTELARTVFQSAYTTLALCVRAINFCWGEDNAERLGSQSDMVYTWRALVDDLSLWYSRRPHEFMSMVEVDDNDDGFPTILFTNGAAVFGNQLYHTAMFLLLQHKPRTAAMLGSRHASSSMSTLLHARRVCGIALSNDRRECWDVTLISSLFVAARTMTHEAQHQAIFEALNRIEGLTGWKLGGIKDILTAEWAL